MSNIQFHFSNGEVSPLEYDYETEGKKVAFEFEQHY